MSRPGWYVLQIEGGREVATASLIARMAPQGLVRECFAPSFVHDVKYKGVWYPTGKVMFPGYVVAVTDDPRELRCYLAHVPRFARLLGAGGQAVTPLSDTDRSLIERLTEPGSRTVANSTAYAVGDRVVVTAGPLMGHEGWITAFNRKKSMAFLRVEGLFGRDYVTGRAGLQVLERREKDD